MFSLFDLPATKMRTFRYPISYVFLTLFRFVRKSKYQRFHKSSRRYRLGRFDQRITFARVCMFWNKIPCPLPDCLAVHTNCDAMREALSLDATFAQNEPPRIDVDTRKVFFFSSLVSRWTRRELYSACYFNNLLPVTRHGRHWEHATRRDTHPPSPPSHLTLHHQRDTNDASDTFLETKNFCIVFDSFVAA